MYACAEGIDFMKIKFLGTGAADWVRGGEEFRAFTSTLINGRLLIDGTPDAMDHIADTGAITDIIYTHSHDDHFNIDFLKAIAPVRAHIHKSWAANVKAEGVEVIPFDTGETFKAADHSITALPANHSTADPNEQPVHFIVRDDSCTLFYATDGAWLLNAEWHALRKEQLDAAIFDATIGEGNPGDFRVFEHNSIEMVRIITRTLRNPMFGYKDAGKHIPPVLKDGAPVYLTHMARTLHPTKAVLERSLAGEFIAAYDGMEVEI